MAGFFLALLVAITSTLASFVGRWRTGMRLGQVPEAVGAMLECLGAVAVFYAANLVVGVLLVLVTRSLSPVFLPAYLAADPSLLVLSLGQGLVFHFWARRAKVSS